MVLTNPPTHTPSTTPDTTDNDSPRRIQPIRQFPNGASNNHHCYHHHHQQPPPQQAVTYRECLRNHAANMGGHALDGCGEFMPSPTTATDFMSLNCAACGCHRNFHRREVQDYTPSNTAMGAPHIPEFLHPRLPSSLFYPSSQILHAISTAVPDDLQVPNHHHQVENLSGRKRFRTKFSQEQKDKMHYFAEKVGWKLQKRDKNIIQNFCNEIGVARGVLKVWMHNNKSTFARKDLSNTNPTTATPIVEEDGDDNTYNDDDNNIHTNNSHHTGGGGMGGSGYDMNIDEESGGLC